MDRLRCPPITQFLMFLCFCIIVSASLLIVGCSEERIQRKLEKQYAGEGTIHFKKAVMLFQADGIDLEFDDFALSSSFKRTYHIKNLPVLADDPDYTLLFIIPEETVGANWSPQEQEKRIQDALAQSIVSARLVDRSKGTLWEVKGKLEKAWGRSEIRKTMDIDGKEMNIGRYLFSSMSSSCEIEPKKKNEYELEISYEPSDACKEILGEGRFILSAGGYK